MYGTDKVKRINKNKKNKQSQKLFFCKKTNKIDKPLGKTDL